jgi:hypothetical protein
MAATMEIACPSCAKKMKVPEEFAGKLIRCKGCEATFEVPDPNAPKKAKPTAAKPAAAKPAAAKAAKPAKPKEEAADAPMKFQEEETKPALPSQRVPKKYEEDEDDNSDPYGVNKDDELEVPRCPFCAKELDPPDTMVCLNCGYDLMARKRHGSKKVYELQTGDYLKHWLPGIIWLIIWLVVFTLIILCFIFMSSWLEGSFLEMDEKNKVTEKAQFYLPPFCFNIWIGIFGAFFLFKSGKFIVKRLIYEWRPAEKVKKD